MAKVRWGIIGPGKIAHQFANDIQYTSNSELVAVASNSSERANSFASKYNIPKVYGSYQDLFNDEEVDMVYVATTHNFHFDNCIAAIEMGKGVMCEKPITDNLDDAKRLFEVANTHGVYLMEALWTYFLPTIQKAQEWVSKGRIGQIITIKSDFGFKKVYNPESRSFNPKLSGGCLLDMGIYPIAIASLFLKEDPETYKVEGIKATTGVDADETMQFIYPEAVANLHSSFLTDLNNHAYIIGENGYIDIPDFWRARECFLFNESGVLDHFQDNRLGDGFEFEIEAAAADYQNGRLTSAIMPPEFSLKLQHHMREVMKRI